MLNADAETFVPEVGGQASLCYSAGDQLRQHSLDVRPKVRNVDTKPPATFSHQPSKLELIQNRSTTQTIHTHPCLDRDLSAPEMKTDTSQGPLISVLERQNEITSLLVEQQSLFRDRIFRFFMGVLWSTKLSSEPSDTGLSKRLIVQETAYTFLSSTPEGSLGRWSEAVSICHMKVDMLRLSLCSKNTLEIH